jgi:uncharacterized protein (DUF2252 family)
MAAKPSTSGKKKRSKTAPGGSVSKAAAAQPEIEAAVAKAEAEATAVVEAAAGAVIAETKKKLKKTKEAEILRKGLATSAPAPLQKEPAPLVRVMPHLTPSEHIARGKAARAETPRSDHASWEPSALRPDPIAILEQQAVTRVPELVPIRYGRMMVSPFTFYRGAAAIMAADLAATPRSGLLAQLCGDAHLSNFGIFAAPDRALVFDINDFDETLPGPWEWDLKRLAVSFEIAGRNRGFAPDLRRDAVLTVVRSYRDAMKTFAAQSNLDVWYARLDTDTIMGRLREMAAAGKKGRALKQVADNTERGLAKARSKDSLKAFGKLTTVVDGSLQIVSDPPLIVRLADLLGADSATLATMQESLHGIFRAYRTTLPDDRRRLLESYRVVDIARKVVGVGSVGTRAWIVLTLGRDETDPLFLQFKEAQASVLEPFVGKSRYVNHGRRVVEGQRFMQAAGDIMLGWTRVTGIDGQLRDFYVRQLWDGKGSADLEVILPAALSIYGIVCGWTLARAHARSGDRIAIAAYLGNGDVFPQALADFSRAYADQNERDYELMVAAVHSGRLVAETGL